MSEVSRWMPVSACSTAFLVDRDGSRSRLLTVAEVLVVRRRLSVSRRGRSHLVTGGHPLPLPPVNHTAPVPRRIRAVLNGHVVVDTISALYVWEWSHYPQYYIPVGDIDPAVLVDEQYEQKLSRGTARRYSLQVGDVTRPAALRVYGDDAVVEGLAGRARFEWDSLDAWFEEDEQVFVHPRDPYTRVDALRSTRSVRIELDGVILAESSSPVLVFETGLPTRYYLNRNEVDFTHLVPTDSVTACPYKGTTSGYWTAQLGDTSYPDIAWVYDFPTCQLLPIAGLIAFYDEQVDTFLDGRLLDPPEKKTSLLRED
jgi:uncharacterized protein (DUF427 family)